MEIVFLASEKEMNLGQVIRLPGTARAQLK